jgi:hypothetical protein
MEANKKLEALEEELKLMKGELKQTLASVRDYLLSMELPSSEFATILAALGDGDNQKVTMKGILNSDKDAESGEPTLEEKDELTPEEPQEESLQPESELSPEEEDLISPDESLATESELPPEDELINQDENPEPEAELLPEEEAGEPDEQDEPLMPESDLLIEEEQQMEQENINAEVSQSIPKVNLLANLISWIAKAKKEIGPDQMPTFLEVYGISGHLSPELKEVILHLADITSEQPEDANKAEIWSQAMLSLHGILTGGEAPLYPVLPSWNDGSSEIQPSEDDAPEMDKSEDMPVKLKLVFPNGDGKSKEFCIDLTPETDKGGS